MGRQLVRIGQMIDNYVRNHREEPSGIIVGGSELRELVREVGGIPFILCRLPVYMVEHDVLVVVRDASAVQGVKKVDLGSGRPDIGEDGED